MPSTIMSQPKQPPGWTVPFALPSNDRRYSFLGIKSRSKSDNDILDMVSEVLDSLYQIFAQESGATPEVN